jgi:hypothetical protein
MTVMAGGTGLTIEDAVVGRNTSVRLAAAARARPAVALVACGALALPPDGGGHR